MTTTRPADTRPWNDRPLFTHPGRAALRPEVAALLAWGSDGGQGYANQGDVLVDQTSDGVDLNSIWNQAAQALSSWNRERSALASLISYPTVAVGDAIPQALGGANFEKASEYGEPQGIRSQPDALILSYDFEDYDLASRMTWKFLRAATAEQVSAAINSAFEADNRLVTGTLLRRLFDPTEGLNEHAHRVFGLWNGTDGMTPPPHAGQSFPSTTSHYLASNNAAIDPGDLVDAIDQVRSKGFGISGNTQLIVLCHPNEAEEISTFKAGVETNGVTSKFDFIPSETAPAYLTEENVVGKIAPGEFGGLEVSGSYGPAWIIPSYFVPQGYLAVVATGGPNSSLNPVAFRQHTNLAYQGLRIIPGRDQRYPLQDSFFQRSFGCGVRYRSAACVVQVTAGSVYTAPTWEWS
ncbi:MULTISPECIES: hypothetical protein [Rhodococcus]|uniref:Bacteriophage protein n=1 Tax=Rhodococcus oxybenzonivorans TaxID=1990687 RepID=A0AAE4V2Y3_9NOCA|nr:MULTISPECIES: hypothetical protein [Rhodococcus]MDV7246756.1 hypothetical protein [Rhodococcus oxybenzonivorans]MDV7267091.1 hypothetical protein [Rhodococcus oxybenzonivorans]MDV7278360.1 hypothetical protein [Rhodococcus oxybenzonivorans]MDV7337770.1 hypothetical protein [Rhodococcus oxybenzonivorans]MDV7346728.1 hypothetical protein [Rhodococcus oxybenzonivorans]